MRVHGYQTNTEPWNYSPEMVEQEKSLIDFRYQLMPYIYSQAANVTFSGGTLMRPLVMDFANDPHALDQKYEYMFGPAFLVAPVLDAGVTQAHVYAPQSKGGWFDWWSGKQIAPGTEAVLDAPLGKIPLLVRAGSIIPFGPVQQYVKQKPDLPLELRIYPGADGHFALYNDDGLTYRTNRDSDPRSEWPGMTKRDTHPRRRSGHVSGHALAAAIPRPSPPRRAMVGEGRYIQRARTERPLRKVESASVSEIRIRV